MTAPNNVTPPTPPTVGDGGPNQYNNNQGKKPFYKRWWFWLIVVLVVIGAIGAGQSGSSTTTSASSARQTATIPATESSSSQTASTQANESSASSTETTPAKPAEKTIELQATATGNGTVMINENGSTSSQQFSGSWSKTYTGGETKDLTSISVTGDITGGNDQQVSCKVIVNGQEKVSKDASGAVGSAYCNVPLF